MREGGPRMPDCSRLLGSVDPSTQVAAARATTPRESACGEWRRARARQSRLTPLAGPGRGRSGPGAVCLHSDRGGNMGMRIVAGDLEVFEAVGEQGVRLSLDDQPGQRPRRAGELQPGLFDVVQV